MNFTQFIPKIMQFIPFKIFLIIILYNTDILKSSNKQEEIMKSKLKQKAFALILTLVLAVPFIPSYDFHILNVYAGVSSTNYTSMQYSENLFTDSKESASSLKFARQTNGRFSVTQTNDDPDTTGSVMMLFALLIAMGVIAEAAKPKEN